jgi:fructose-1-phosphate kinase PfkB-like protein
VSVQDVELLVDAARSRGADVAVDGPGDLLAALRGRELWLIKPNTDELAAMLGAETMSPDTIQRTGLELAEKVRYVMVSRGTDGAFLFNGSTAFVGRCDLDRSRVKSTVGCGDALTAGFIAARHRGHDAPTSFSHALAVAAAAAMEGIPGRVNRAALAGFLPKAQVDVVA